MTGPFYSNQGILTQFPKLLKVYSKYDERKQLSFPRFPLKLSIHSIYWQNSIVLCHCYFKYTLDELELLCLLIQYNLVYWLLLFTFLRWTILIADA